MNREIKYISGKNIKKIIKGCPVYYFIFNLKNGFWKKGLQVEYGSYNVLLYEINVKNKGINNSLYIGGGSTLRNCSIKISGNNNKIYIAEGCSLNGLHLYMEDDNNEIYLGIGTTTTDDVEMSTIEGTKLRVGDDSMLSSHIYISTGDGHSVCNSDCNQRTNHSDSIMIGDHVWIGTRVVIGKGVRIGKNSIVAAGSVCVKKNREEENVIWGGNPAKVVKKDVSWMRKRI